MRAPDAARFRPGLEQFEDRTVPALTITAVADAHEGGTGGYFRVTRDGSTASAQTIVLAAPTGTAATGSDFSNVPGYPTYRTIAAGDSYLDIAIDATDDSTSEPTETVNQSVAVYTMMGASGWVSATLSILDNDAQVVTVTKVDTAEGGTGSFQFARIGDLSSSLTANYTLGGTATLGTDYTAIGTSVTFATGASAAAVNVVALADNVVEGSESVIAAVTTGTGYTVGSLSNATVTIADDPPVIAVTATDTSEGSATGGFTFTRSGGKLAASLTATYTISGTATSGTDYTAISGSGSVTFAAGVDRVEVAVEALGDNVADDGETVIATLTGAGTGYTIDSDAGAATVTIADQPLTISVVQLTDGEEGVSNGQFRFLRSGDISTSLTMSYTVSGTAVSGTDFTSIGTSVTFAANSDHTDVTVTVTNDTTVEDTETVIVTLAEDDDYLLGNASDTVFIKDNDTNRVHWISTSSTYWGVDTNWSTGFVPTQCDDVYFDIAYTVNCTNAGAGLGTLAGLHIGGAYTATVTLANELSVGTYEQTAAKLDQVDAGYNLTVTKALLWTGGTLNSIDSGASVNISGAIGRIDPPDDTALSIATASSLSVVNGAVVTLLPGILEFIGGIGILAQNAKVEVFTKENVDVNLTKPSWSEAAVEVA